MITTVIGLGFVGLTTALGLAEYGHKVYGMEADEERLSAIQAGRLPFLEPGLDEALARHLGKCFFPCQDWENAIAESEIIFFCVGTPYGKDGQAELCQLYAAFDQVLNVVHDDKFRVLVTKSTIPPSTTERRIIPFLEERGISLPGQFGVANNPEFLREGHCWDDFINADRIVLGVSDERSEELLRRLYENSGVPVYSVSLNTGEFIKYLSNTSLACLISFANEMSLAADAIGGVDTAEAFRLVHLDKRWQSGTIRSYFYPGCGYGGYCLPKDTNAFYAMAQSVGFEGNILREVIATNNSMPEMAARRIIKVAEDNKEICIGILGLSFNAGSDDVRDTPSAKIIAELNRQGYYNVLAYDPVAMEPFHKAYSNRIQFELAVNYQDMLERGDVFAITTAWKEFKGLRRRTEKKVVDCRYML